MQVDGTVIPEDMGLDGFRLGLDMALFDEMDGFDESILERPSGLLCSTSTARKSNSI